MSLKALKTIRYVDHAKLFDKGGLLLARESLCKTISRHRICCSLKYAKLSSLYFLLDLVLVNINILYLSIKLVRALSSNANCLLIVTENSR
jgi:hypothetical protein